MDPIGLVRCGRWTRWAGALALGIGVAGVGCGSKGDDAGATLVGKWTFDVERQISENLKIFKDMRIDGQPISADSIRGTVAKDDGETRVEIRGDGGFSARRKESSGWATETGTWKGAGGSLELTVREVEGKPVESRSEGLNLKREKDGAVVLRWTPGRQTYESWVYLRREP